LKILQRAFDWPHGKLSKPSGNAEDDILCAFLLDAQLLQSFVDMLQCSALEPVLMRGRVGQELVRLLRELGDKSGEHGGLLDVDVGVLELLLDGVLEVLVPQVLVA